MERGQDKRITKTKRIEPRVYARIKEQEKQNNKDLKRELETAKNTILNNKKELDNTKSELSKEKAEKLILEGKTKESSLTKKIINEMVEKTRKAMLNENKQRQEDGKENLYNAEDYKQLRELKNVSYKNIDELESILRDFIKTKRESEALKAENENLKKEMQKKDEETQKLKKNNNAFNETFKKISANVGKPIQQATYTIETQAKEINTQIDTLKKQAQNNDKIKELESKIDNLQEENKGLKAFFENVINSDFISPIYQKLPNIKGIIKSLKENLQQKFYQRVLIDYHERGKKTNFANSDARKDILQMIDGKDYLHKKYPATIKEIQDANKKVEIENQKNVGRGR